ncbi:TPA: hypothetical protein N0F65_007471, partial [Lagenidium giganteum]
VVDGTESLLADFDHDGRVGSNEIKKIKQDLHGIFDIDESGGIDTKEIKSILNDEHSDIAKAFQKLDRDHDSIISLKELDERWEKVGAEMTVNEVADWVAYSVQLPEYSDMFRRHSISGFTFPLLMANDGIRLQEIGVKKEFHRQQLAMFMRMKYLGMGKRPDKPLKTSCTIESEDTLLGQRYLRISWTPADDVPQRFQLQRRSPDAYQLVVYRLSTWNSYGRSDHTFVRCPGGSTQAAGQASREQTTADAAIEEENLSLFGLIKSYLWWLDEAIALTLFIVLPIRGFIYGDANYVLRLLRRLPPNMPTRVLVEADPSRTSMTDAAVTVSWEQPLDNGVPIVQYCVRWMRTKTEDVKWIKLLTKPLLTNVSIDRLRHGETYKFVVEATNEFGLVTKSSRSTYMVPVPELKNAKMVSRRSIKEAKVVRNQCHVCADPVKSNAVPFSAMLDKKILHFCCRCDREFCHYHRGDVHHTKALSCPAVDGRCVCEKCFCKEVKEPRAKML